MDFKNANEGLQYLFDHFTQIINEQKAQIYAQRQMIVIMNTLIRSIDNEYNLAFPVVLNDDADSFLKLSSNYSGGDAELFKEMAKALRSFDLPPGPDDLAAEAPPFLRLVKTDEEGSSD